MLKDYWLTCLLFDLVHEGLLTHDLKFTAVFDYKAWTPKIARYHRITGRCYHRTGVGRPYNSWVKINYDAASNLDKLWLPQKNFSRYIEELGRHIKCRNTG